VLRQGFATLLGPPIPPDPVVPIPECDEPCSLSQDISTFEIAEAINRLTRGKATGLDGVKAEFVIDGYDTLLAILQTLFNKLFNEGLWRWESYMLYSRVGMPHPLTTTEASQVGML
jgi:hypothetical protein